MIICFSFGQTHKRVEQYLPEDMRLEETSVRRSLMTSVQREQVERLLADDNEVKVKKEKEELKEEGRRRSSRHSTATRYKQDSESESAESDLEEMLGAGAGTLVVPFLFLMLAGHLKPQ